MKVLMITGDKRFGPGNPRFALQAAQVEKLEVAYMGPGSVWPRMPAGQFDVVTAQDPFWRGLYAWMAARRLGARLNIQVHASNVSLLGKFILRRADSIRVVSEKIKRQVEELRVRAPVRVLPIFVDTAPFAAVARQPHAQKTILWVGRFEEEKDPLLALAVLRQVPGAKLVMLGAGSLEPQLKDAARGLPVEFPGWQEPASFLAQADVVLCTSKQESWGASIVEALAAGVPVVAPDVGVAKAAGAVVVPRAELGKAVAEVLRTGARGALQLPMLSPTQWAAAWLQTL